MPRETPSPIDLPEPDEPARSALGWATGAIALASLLLLVMNGVALRDWIEDLPPGPIQARGAELAESWVKWIDDVGLSAPRALLHDGWKRAEAARFEPSSGAGEGPQPADQR